MESERKETSSVMFLAYRDLFYGLVITTMHFLTSPCRLWQVLLLSLPHQLKIQWPVTEVKMKGVH